MAAERREHQRIPVDLLFRYEIEEMPPGLQAPLTRTQTLLVSDISRGGAKIDAEQHLPEGVLLDISIMQRLVSGPIHLAGKVVWSRRQADSSQCGIQFVYFKENSKPIFDEYLDRLEKTPVTELKKVRKEVGGLAAF